MRVTTDLALPLFLFFLSKKPIPSRGRRTKRTHASSPSTAFAAPPWLPPGWFRCSDAAIAGSPAPYSHRGFSFPPPASAGLRSLLTVTGASNTATDPQDQQDSETNPPPASVPTPEPGFKARDTSNLKISPRHDLAMIFTCKVCETRSVKMASKDSYQNGVVVVRCGGCNNLHLIADRLGWFGEPGSIEDFLATQGEEVKKGSTDTLNFTLDDLTGSQVSSKGPSEQN